MDEFKEQSTPRISDHIKIIDLESDEIIYNGRGVSKKINTDVNKDKDKDNV